MNSIQIRSRLLTAGGASLAAVGLAAAMVAGPALAQEADDDTTATAEVTSVISISAASASASLVAAPNGNDTDTGTLTVTTNIQGGYTVDVAADTEHFVADESGDTIALDALTINTVPLDEVAAQVASGGSTDSEGDEVGLAYSMTMPWVEADTYRVGLTYTATAGS